MYESTEKAERVKEFKTLSNQLIKWLNDNYHPHTTIIITPTSAELVEWLMFTKTDEFIKD